MKYRLKAPDGTPIDRDLADSWARVALALSEAVVGMVRPHVWHIRGRQWDGKIYM